VIAARVVQHADDPEGATDLMVKDYPGKNWERVGWRFDARKMVVPLSQLDAIDPDESTQFIGIRHRRLALLGRAGPLPVIYARSLKLTAHRAGQQGFDWSSHLLELKTACARSFSTITS